MKVVASSQLSTVGAYIMTIANLKIAISICFLKTVLLNIWESVIDGLIGDESTWDGVTRLRAATEQDFTSTSADQN